jgi:1,2-phenylacetyl-CoA epoxidase PaaB subunit
MMTEKTPANAEQYECKLCNFICCKTSDYKRHLSTRKHKMMTNDDNYAHKNAELFICNNCNKCYKYRQGLSLHKKKCNPSIATQDASNNYVVDKELVMMLIKENSELKNMMIEEHKSTQQMMLEVIKNGTHNTTNNNTNSHNKTFNLQFFLNETCKNAMNIMDFVDSLKLQLTDLERMGEIGFVNGMSNIIIKNLQNMDVTERPVHCTDKKREIIYVKDADKWDKEDDTKPKLRKAIKHIAHKNAKLIGEFKVKHPDYCKSASQISTQYNTMVIEAMGGIGSNDLCNENKIIKRISKEIMVDKD